MGHDTRTRRLQNLSVNDVVRGVLKGLMGQLESVETSSYFMILELSQICIPQ